MSVPQLKPSMSCSLNADDKAFVLELAKVGHVNILTSQVSLMVAAKRENYATINFSDNASTPKCEGLQLPSNWAIEYISYHEDMLKLLFTVSKV
jgi:hypothetical protein